MATVASLLGLALITYLLVRIDMLGYVWTWII